jgi:hypothetical protein
MTREIARKAIKIAIVVLLVSGLFYYCSRPTPPNPAVSKGAGAEKDFASLEDDEAVLRTEARRTVTDFFKTHRPDWKLKGISSTHYYQNIFWVAVNLEKDQRDTVVNLAVRKFFSESGDEYWRVVPLRTTLEEQLHDLDDQTILRELDEQRRRDDSN